MNNYMLTVVFLALVFYHTRASAQVANRLDVLITEVFADPTPAVGLPQYEFIELRNVSTKAVNLKDWKISDRNSTSIISANFILHPDSIVILCSNAASVVFKRLGNSLAVSSFPSLDNDADQISIRSKEGFTIHAIMYDKAWYQNDVKSDGGWTLEMIDTRNPCSGTSNWKSSTDPDGGTPGKINSVNGNNPDDRSPALLRTYTNDSSMITAVFDEPVDSLTAAIVANYQLDENIQPVHASPIAPLFEEVRLKFADPFLANRVYHLTGKNIGDCTGNTLGMRNKAKAGRQAVADTSDIAINEILFNPKGDGSDFVELYNKSKKIIDLKELYVANRSGTGGMLNTSQVSTVPYLLFPGEYIVLTENALWLRQNYSVQNVESVWELSSLPSFPDDKGSVVILNSTGKILEEVQYDSKWHFALIENDEGVSVERIDYSQPPQNKNNWTSAASTAGYATPGYQNSQFRADKQLQGIVSASPKIFSPDNDGFDDFVTIQYQMPAPGFVANTTIFDATGRAVRYLVKNATLSQQGNFRWDGVDDKLQKLPIGMYIVFTEVFNLQGKTKRYKNAITLARKL